MPWPLLHRQLQESALNLGAALLFAEHLGRTRSSGIETMSNDGTEPEQADWQIVAMPRQKPTIGVIPATRRQPLCPESAAEALQERWKMWKSALDCEYERDITFFGKATLKQNHNCLGKVPETYCGRQRCVLHGKLSFMPADLRTAFVQPCVLPRSGTGTTRAH